MQAARVSEAEWKRIESSGIGRKTIGTTNIYYDCLERIFDYLDLESLLNLAQTCKRLQIAAAAKFSDAYGKICILVNPHRMYKNGHV